MKKRTLLILSILFLLFPLLFFLKNGALVGTPCCEWNLFSLRVIYNQFGPTSLIIGLILLAFYFVKPLKEHKKTKDYLISSALFLVPALVLTYMIIATVNYPSQLNKFRDCVEKTLILKNGGGFNDIEKQAECLNQSRVGYKLEPLGEWIEFNGPTSFFPYLTW